METALRVLAVLPGDGQGYSFIFARRQLEVLARLGCEIDTYYLATRSSPRGVLAHVRALRRRVRETKPDVVHGHYGTVTACVAALGAGNVPLVVTLRGSDVNGDPGVSPVRAGIGRVLSQVAALRSVHVICVSERLRDRLWCDADRVSIIPSGIDLELFQPMPRDAARRALGWSLDDRVVLFLEGGRPVLKGRALVEAAVRHAERAVGAIRWVVLDGNVAPDDVPTLLNAADCLAFASLREGSPNIVKEALACNLPIVSVDVGDVAKRLEGVTSSFVVARDAAAFGDALARVLAQPVRSNGRDHVRHLDHVAMAREIRAVYERAIRG